MTNTKALKEAIQKSGLKLKAIAKLLNISGTSLSRKINNITEFKASEIIALSEILQLDTEKELLIFFNK